MKIDQTMEVIIIYFMYENITNAWQLWNCSRMWARTNYFKFKMLKCLSYFSPVLYCCFMLPLVLDVFFSWCMRLLMLWNSKLIEPQSLRKILECLLSHKKFLYMVKPKVIIRLMQKHLLEFHKRLSSTRVGLKRSNESA